MSDLLGDLRIAARRLRHSPGFVLVAVLSLTMAITANLVVFGVLNAAVLRPLNVAGADRLWQIEHKEHGYISHSYPDFQDLRAHDTTFSDMAAFRIGEAAREQRWRTGEEELDVRSFGQLLRHAGRAAGGGPALSRER